MAPEDALHPTSPTRTRATIPQQINAQECMRCRRLGARAIENMVEAGTEDQHMYPKILTAHPWEYVHDTCALVLTSAAHCHDREPHAWKVLWCERGGGETARVTHGISHGDCPDPTQQAASCTPYLTYSMRPSAFTHSTPPQQIRINMLASTVIVWGRQKNTVHVQDIM